MPANLTSLIFSAVFVKELQDQNLQDSILSSNHFTGTLNMVDACNIRLGDSILGEAVSSFIYYGKLKHSLILWDLVLCIIISPMPSKKGSLICLLALQQLLTPLLFS